MSQLVKVLLSQAQDKRLIALSRAVAEAEKSKGVMDLLGETPLLAVRSVRKWSTRRLSQMFAVDLNAMKRQKSAEQNNADGPKQPFSTIIKVHRTYIFAAI